MFTEIAPDECCTFLFDSPSRLSFWGKNTPQDLWLNCVSDGVVREALRIAAGSLEPVTSEGGYVVAFEALGGFEGRRVSFSPSGIEVL